MDASNKKKRLNVIGREKLLPMYSESLATQGNAALSWERKKNSIIRKYNLDTNKLEGGGEGKTIIIFVWNGETDIWEKNSALAEGMITLMKQRKERGKSSWNFSVKKSRKIGIRNIIDFYL